MVAGTTYERHHATLFVPDVVSAPLEAMRRRWDPEMAGQIAAHVTLVYPWEASNSADIEEWVREVAPSVEPLRLRTGALHLDSDDEGGGCGFEVIDCDGGYEDFRSRISAPDFAAGAVAPHVTIVHPRTSRRGRDAWLALRAEEVTIEFVVAEVAITAWNGERWPTVATIPLGAQSGSHRSHRIAR